MKYPAPLLHYFHHRQHAGQLDTTNPYVQYVRVGHPQNEEVIDLYVHFHQNRVKIAKFQAASSVTLIAAAEFICGWLEGKSHQEIALLNPQLILQELGLTDLNIHIANLMMMAVRQLNCMG